MGDVLTANEFQTTIGEVTGALEDIPVKYTEFVDEVEYWASYLWDSAVEGIMTALEWIGDQLTWLINKINDIFSFMGDPWTLWTTGTSWTEDVGNKASASQDCYTSDYMKTDKAWQGSAADAYRKMLQPQNDALDGIKSTTDKLDSLLGDVAIAIGVFWIAVAAALGMFLFELIGELAAASSGVGIGAAVAAAAASCGKTVGIIAGAVTLIEGLLINEIAPTTKSLKQQIGDMDGFPKGHWPKLATGTDISDSSHQENKGKDAPWDMVAG